MSKFQNQSFERKPCKGHFVAAHRVEGDHLENSSQEPLAGNIAIPILWFIQRFAFISNPQQQKDLFFTET